MIDRIGTTTRIECVTVCQEGFGSQFFQDTYHTGCIVRTDISQVTRLSKMDLDGHKLPLEIDVRNAGSSDYTLHLVQQVTGGSGAQIGKIYFRRHDV